MVKYVIFITLFISQVLSQNSVNQTFIQKILDKESIISNLPKDVPPKLFRIIFNQKLFINSNLPNLENIDGLYLPKGFGSINSYLVEYKNHFLYFSAEPQLYNVFQYPTEAPTKENIFSVLNDVELVNSASFYNQVKNMGLKLHYKKLSFGYGNWNHWWGPGIHNSLGLSNNSNGFYHFYADLQNYEPLKNNFYINAKFLTSSEMNNFYGVPYYLTSWQIDFNYENISVGLSNHILTGGIKDIPWSFKEALFVPFSKNNMKYWDKTNLYYISYSNKSETLKIYYEWGFPNRSFGNYSPSIFSDHSRANTLGLIKYSIFDSDNFFVGFEITRLLQSSYYYKIPSPNWYDNIKYNFSSFNNRRWAAHSGSDSDDLLIFLGYSLNNLSVVYGLNFERHGITFHFPPEVKFENKIFARYSFNKFDLYLILESEYFENYAFLNNNQNIWKEKFEPASIQRTKTVLFSLSKSLF